MSDEQCLADQLTPITPTALYAALRAAAPRAVGCDLSRASRLVLLAHVAEETGWRACHRYNLGNIKHVAGDGHDYCMFRCNEIIGGKEVWIDPPDPGCRFRAYASLEDGCVDYLALLKRQFRFAWTAVLAGDPAQFAHLLKTQHYYTADEGQYTRNVVALDAQLAHLVADDPSPAPVAEAALAQAAVAFDPGPPTPPEDLTPAVS